MSEPEVRDAEVRDAEVRDARRARRDRQRHHFRCLQERREMEKNG
jgi:hypothetical protein